MERHNFFFPIESVRSQVRDSTGANLMTWQNWGKKGFGTPYVKQGMHISALGTHHLTSHPCLWNYSSSVNVTGELAGNFLYCISGKASSLSTEKSENSKSTLINSTTKKTYVLKFSYISIIEF